MGSIKMIQLAVLVEMIVVVVSWIYTALLALRLGNSQTSLRAACPIPVPVLVPAVQLLFKRRLIS